MNNLEQFRKIPLFDDLDEHALKSLADRAQIQRYAPDERIISQADNVQAFFVVLSGRVKIFRSNAEGKEQIMYIVGQGQPFCFCTAFTNHPYPVNVNALEQSTVSSIPAQHMEDIALKEPLLLLKIMQILTRRLLDSMNMIESLSLHGITKRVASFLLLAESTSPIINEHPGLYYLSHARTFPK